MTAVLAAWRRLVHDLCTRIRIAVRDALASDLRSDAPGRIARPVSLGAGDVTFGLDEPAERAISIWLDEVARTRPLSLLTEDAGWRHLGPDPRGGPRPVPLEGFDHGGPRIAIDPIDGTRNLMVDMRSAWTVIGIAGPGAGVPRASDLVAGVVSELPVTLGARFRLLEAERGGACVIEERSADGERSPAEPLARRVLQADGDDRAGHGYFSFFNPYPATNLALPELEAAFFSRLAAHERSDLRSCYGDRYISSAGQLVLLALGTYRMIADLRGYLGPRALSPWTTCKPYDVSGALVCAEAAGCTVVAPDGSPLEFPLDTQTPVSFVGYANPGTARRLGPHLAAALGLPSR